MKRYLALAVAAALLFCFACFAQTNDIYGEILVDDGIAITQDFLVEYGYDYYLTDEVALYLHVFRELPPNYITKDEAYDLGWSSKKGNLWEVGYGFVIGGDEFGNREGRLPDAYDRQWYECDVNYEGGYRGSERILFSNDGLVYVTLDHYETFEMIFDGWYADELGLYLYPRDTYTSLLYDEYYVDPYTEIYGY